MVGSCRPLREAINWLAKEIPKSEHKMEKVQMAAYCVTRAAEHGGPMIFAQMGMMEAIHRHQGFSIVRSARDQCQLVMAALVLMGLGRWHPQ